MTRLASTPTTARFVSDAATRQADAAERQVAVLKHIARTLDELVRTQHTIGALIARSVDGDA